MALSCKINEQLFTFNGKEYNYNEFRALMYDGLLDQALKPAAPAAQVAATTAPKGAVDASDADAMQGLMERHEGINANKVSKPQLIGRVVNGIRWLTNNKLGYDANTGKGNRIFVAESKAEYERITKDASGKAKTGGGVAIPRYDADGNYMGADIYINLDTKSLGTVAHELAHVALMEKFAGDPNLFKKFVAAIKPFTSAKDLAYLDKFIRQYPDEDARPEEFLAEMTAKIEERFADGEVDAKELSALRKLAEAIKQFINKLTGGLVFPLEKESDVRAFFNALGQSIAVGGVMKEGLAEAAAREVDEAFSKQIAAEANKPAELRERIEDPAFGPKIKYKKGGYALSLVKESDLIDIKALVKKIADEGGRVWFWTADQLGRGMYSDDTLLGEHYLDAGPSFALDPKNRKNNVIWASGLDSKTLNGYIGKSDYIFIVSGSPQKSKLFNKAVTKVLKERAEKATGLSWDDFTKKLIELDSQKEDGRPKKATVISSILEKYKSFDEFLESGDRKDFFLQLEDAMGKKTTALAKYLKDKNYSLDVNALRDGFYAENEFGANDVMIVLKATGVDETQRHATYNKSIIGEVIGVPDRRVNAINLLPEEQQAKLSSALRSGTPMGGAGGATVRTLGTPLFETVETKPRREAMERKEDEGVLPAEKESARQKLSSKNKNSLRVRMTREALTDAALKQESWKDWYEEHQDVLDEFFGDYAQLFQDILSITSQAASVKANVGLALKAFGIYLRGESFNGLERGEPTAGFLPAVIKNLDRLRGEAELQGQKIRAYKASNDGKVDEAVIDRHISRLLFGVDTPSKAQFAKAQKVLSEVADELGWTPRQVQAALWAHSIYKSKKTPESYGAYLKSLEAAGKVKGKIGGFGPSSTRGDESVRTDKERGRFAPSSKKQIEKSAPRREVMERKEDEAFNGIEEPKTPIGDTKTVMVDGKERTVFNSEGRPIHPTVEGVRNFWRWFGDSKVVDRQGRPMVVYHGSPIAGTEVFDPEVGGELVKSGLAKYGTYFTSNPEVASAYAAGRRREDGVTSEQSVYPVYLKIENPVEVNGGGGTFQDWVNKLSINIGYKTAWGFDALQVLAGKNTMVGKNPANDGLVVKNTADIQGGSAERQARLMGTMYATFKPAQIKSATGNYGRFDPKRREIMERKEDELPPDTPEETRKVITVAQRRLNKIEGDEKRATERDVLLGERNNYESASVYKTAVDQARDFVAETYAKHRDLLKDRVAFVKAVHADIKAITNDVSKVVAYGEVQAMVDSFAELRKLSAKERKEMQRISALMVSEMAFRAREMGQANAALALVYSNYGKFDSLVQAEKINQDFTAKLNSTEGSEEGKTIADNIEEARDEIKETLGQNKEIADVVDLAEEINDALEDGQAAKIAAGKSTPLDQPKTVTAEQLVNDPSSYEKIISDLEAEVKRLDGLLAEANKLYSSAAADAASYAQQIADLNREINRKNKLIDKLKAKKDEIAKERDKYKSQLETLKQKIQDLKDINKLLAQKRVGKNRLSPSVIEKLRQQLLDLALAGKLNDPDFDSVFAAITGSNFLTTQDRKAIEHMANALKYFESAGSKEMAQKYVKRLNDYLEQQSKSPWTAAKVAMFLESLFYNSVLSSIGTLQNAFVGSILVSIPNATATSISTALKNKKSGLGAMLYGVMRMLKELPTAVSKGAFNQGAYDSMGTSWSVDSVSKRADPFEVHLLNGWMIHLNKVINDPTLLGKSKASVWLIASTLAQATRVTALMKFIDPVLRHSIAAHMEGMHDYIRIKEEMRLKKEGDASIAEAWTPYFSPKLIKKIDEMAGVARADRSVAAFTALREIATMKSKGITVKPDYARRRTSDIMRSKRDAEQSLVADKMAADMSMMWRPDGMIGNAWDKSKKYFSIREDDGPFKAFGKLFTNLTLLPFLRISGSGVNIIQTTTPVIGWFFAKYGRAKDKNGDWYWGSKKSENIEDREFAVRRMGMRIAVHHLSCLAFASLMINVFDLEDGEDEDEEGNVTVKPDAVNVFGYNMLIKLDPDRSFDFTADARGSKSANQGISEGRENFSFRMRRGSDDEWTDWISVRLAPHMTIPVAMLGRLSDDANRLYAEPAFGSGKVPGRAKFYEYFTTLPLTALGEVSFQTLPRAFSKAKYDTGGAIARMFMSPVAAIAQPSIYRDVVSTAASMAGASRRGEYMPEGFVETSKAMFSSLYGLNYMVSPEVTDEYGLPIKAIDPIRSWWKNYTEIEERSDDYPEVNLRWRYGNTFIAATPRAQRLESVDRDISTIPPKEGVYSKKIELTKEQQYESALMAKALYRLNTLRKYDYIIAKAESEKAKGKRGEMPGEVVSEELNSVHNETMQIVKSVFSQYASGSKDWTQEKVLKAISEIQTMADERSKQIMEGKPLPPAEKELQYYVGKNVIRVVM